MPGIALVVESVLAIDRSACGVNMSMSVALSLPGDGSLAPAGGATVAVLLSVPVMAGSMPTVRSKLAVSPTASVPVV